MLDRPSILVIDDNPTNFEVIEILLSSENYLLHCAFSGQRALDHLDIFQPETLDGIIVLLLR